MTIGNDVELRRFPEMIGQPGLPDDPRFRTQADRAQHKDALNRIAQDEFATGTMVEWVNRLGDAGILAGAVYEFADIQKDPQARERDLVISVPSPYDGAPPIPTIRNPIRMSATPIDEYRAAPPLGRDTDAVLQDWLGLDAAEVARLRAAKVI